MESTRTLNADHILNTMIRSIISSVNYQICTPSTPSSKVSSLKLVSIIISRLDPTRQPVTEKDIPPSSKQPSIQSIDPPQSRQLTRKQHKYPHPLLLHPPTLLNNPHPLNLTILKVNTHHKNTNLMPTLLPNLLN